MKILNLAKLLMISTTLVTAGHAHKVEQELHQPENSVGAKKYWQAKCDKHTGWWMGTAYVVYSKAEAERKSHVAANPTHRGRCVVLRSYKKTESEKNFLPNNCALELANSNGRYLKKGERAPNGWVITRVVYGSNGHITSRYAIDLSNKSGPVWVAFGSPVPAGWITCELKGAPSGKTSTKKIVRLRDHKTLVVPFATPIPDGWVITKLHRKKETKTIVNTAGKTRMTVFGQSPVPSGWYVVSQEKDWRRGILSKVIAKSK